jgi:hypothetical protein
LYSCSTPSTSSSVAAPGLHLQQQLHQKQSIPGEDHSRNKDERQRRRRIGQTQETENERPKEEKRTETGTYQKTTRDTEEKGRKPENKDARTQIDGNEKNENRNSMIRQKEEQRKQEPEEQTKSRNREEQHWPVIIFASGST